MQKDFVYKIGNGKETLTGVVKAVSPESAASMIKKEGYFLLELTEKSSTLLDRFFGKKVKKFNEVEKINFTDHLGSMMAAGTPIRDALEAYTDNKDDSNVISQTISQDIQEGRTLSQALRRFTETFSPMYISLVKAGETSGSLDETLEYLGSELRREHEFKQRVKSSMYYPMLVMGMSIVVIAMVVTVVLPRVTEVAKSLGTDMPPLTRIIVSISEFLANYGLYLLFAFFGAVYVLYRLYKSPKTGKKMATKMLEMPIVGNIIKEYSLARFFRILGSSIKYGVPIVDALDASLEVVENEEYRTSLKKIRSRVAKGANISESVSFEKKSLFPSLIIRTLKGAERTGSLDKASLRLSLSYELSVDRDLKRLTTLIEPAMVIFLGIVVSLIAISVITPIYQMTTRIG